MCWVGVIILALANVSLSDITVPEGFVVDTLLDRIDGTTPRLEAIRNPDYGFGVVAASVDQGILKVLRISESSVEMFGTQSGFQSVSKVGDIRFDSTGLFGDQFFLTVWSDSPDADWRHCLRTYLMRVSISGEITEVDSYGGPTDQLLFMMDFTTGAGGYSEGAYLDDFARGDGTSLYYLDPNYSAQKLAQDCMPLGRTDLDIWGMEFDRTGNYSFHLTIADSDEYHDNISVIYQLDPNLVWANLTTPVSLSTRYYHDMCFSSGGSFGQQLYVTDRVTNTVMGVEPNGTHTVFASGFNNVESVTVSEDGEHMFVSDADGVCRVRSSTTTVGPTIVMREPWVEDDDVHTGASGVDWLRLLWSERVIFENADVNCVGEDGNSVPFSVSGSNSAFMIIAFGETLLHDKYTITISDSVQSAETGAAIDGDNDGTAGGDSIIVIEHRKRSDFNNDNDVDFNDLANFAMNWLWQE